MKIETFKILTENDPKISDGLKCSFLEIENFEILTENGPKISDGPEMLFFENFLNFEILIENDPKISDGRVVAKSRSVHFKTSPGLQRRNLSARHLETRKFLTIINHKNALFTTLYHYPFHVHLATIVINNFS